MKPKVLSVGSLIGCTIGCGCWVLNIKSFLRVACAPSCILLGVHPSLEK